MKLGAEDKKKVYALAVLGVVMAGSIYYNFYAGQSSTPEPAAKPAVAEDPGSPIGPAPAAANPAVVIIPPRQQTNRASKGDEFHPVLRSKRKEDQIDPFNVDPTLHLDLLAKVQEVKLDGGQRNLFQFGEKAKEVAVMKGPELVIKPTRQRMGPEAYVPPPPPPKPAEAQVPPPPPFTPKYYGLATPIDGKKTAFFLDGEEIILATEGMTVKKRYRLMRINANSVVMLETESKKEQTVQLSEDAGGNIS